MMFGWPCRLLWLALLGGLFCPPSLFAVDYLLCATEMEGTRGLFYELDDEGNLTLREEYPVGYDASSIAVSPDGHTLVVGATTSPTLSVFFIDRDRPLKPPLYLTPDFPAGGKKKKKKIVFYPTLNLFYAGNDPQTSVFRYDASRQSVEATSITQKINLNWWSTNLYSMYADTFIFQTDTNNLPFDTLQSIHVNQDGSFGQLALPLVMPGQTYYYPSISPDGRWVAVGGVSLPDLMFIAVDADGTLTQSDQRDYPNSENILGVTTCFTPDSRHLMMLSQGKRTLTQFDINPTDGTLTEHEQKISPPDSDYTFGGPFGLTVTPDGRYAAFRSINSGNDPNHWLYHNWINIVRLNDDGTMTFLRDKRVDVDHYIGAMAFATLPPKNATGPQWTLYE